ncbi:MAG TPA: double-cubane-cluster-containing anaerobic reductase [Spirochaetota bacterium]|nr:double-cubane-cluster-containing anaerobic reductase [Spirochaetota bacterium]HPF05677.1 double-cubane-cluster-containing anaerobic reductase [Spirochaetota bacterium]
MKFDKEYLTAIEERIFSEGVRQKEAGRKVVGIYCAFTPSEIISAAGAIPVALCAGSQKPIQDAEKHLPRNLCPLIKSSYGFALTDTCPYFHYTDYIFADATCDGKKKMFEILGRLRPLHTLQLPQTSATEESFRYWLNELKIIRSLMEEITGESVTDDRLHEQIKLYNLCREATQELLELNTGEYPLIFGKEIDFITGAGGFNCDIPSRIRDIKDAAAIIKKRKSDSSFIDSVKGKPRILITGCPTTNKKLLDIIEDSGGIVVAMENCGGIKTIGLRVDENSDPLEALARRYLNVPCSCMTPNMARLELIGKLINDYRIDGVVELTWQACHTYNVEAFNVREYVTGEHKKPYIQIETDYSENDIQQIKVRIQAFLELMGG